MLPSGSLHSPPAGRLTTRTESSPGDGSETSRDQATMMSPSGAIAARPSSDAVVAIGSGPLHAPVAADRTLAL